MQGELHSMMYLPDLEIYTLSQNLDAGQKPQGHRWRCVLAAFPYSSAPFPTAFLHPFSARDKCSCNSLIINVLVKGRLSGSKRLPFTSQKAVFYNAKGNLLKNR